MYTKFFEIITFIVFDEPQNRISYLLQTVFDFI